MNDCKSSKLANRFDVLKKQNPDSWACSQFENVNQTPTEPMTPSVHTAAKFASFDTQELQSMMEENDIDFAAIGQEKTAVFVTVSDTDRSMDNLVNMFFTQTMQALCGQRLSQQSLACSGAVHSMILNKLQN